MSEIVKWVLVGWIALNLLLVIGSVGKPREPNSPAVAVLTVVVWSAIVAAILAYWG